MGALDAAGAYLATDGASDGAVPALACIEGTHLSRQGTDPPLMRHWATHH